MGKLNDRVAGLECALSGSEDVLGEEHEVLSGK
jgi:hypothetical protein